MRRRIFTWTIAAMAVILNLSGVHAFPSAEGAIAQAPCTELLLAQAHQAKSRAQDQTQEQANALFQGIGFVTAINPATGSLMINHEEIVGLMPPMEMVFRVEPPTLSDGVKPGDKVEFRIEGKTYRVRDIKVIGHTE